MLLIKNQRIFHNIANTHLNVLSQTLNIRLFLLIAPPLLRGILYLQHQFTFPRLTSRSHYA